MKKLTRLIVFLQLSLLSVVATGLMLEAGLKTFYFLEEQLSTASLTIFDNTAMGSQAAVELEVTQITHEADGAVCFRVLSRFRRECMKSSGGYLIKKINIQ
jgi:hypothetical protein